MTSYACDCCGTRTPLCCISRTRFAGMDTDACVSCLGGNIEVEHAEHSDSNPAWTTDPLWLDWTPVPDDILDREAMARELIPRALKVTR